MKWIVFAAIVLILAALACAPIPKLIEQEASWTTIGESNWEAVWKESFRHETKQTVLDQEITVKTTSRATAWFNESQKAGILAFSTPDVKILGVYLNPFKTRSDEWVLRELARQGGTVAQDKLGITFNPSTIPLALQEAVSTQTPFGVTMNGSRFLAKTPEGDGYATVLRTTHGQDLLILVSVSQSLSASHASTTAIASLYHPAAEPTIRAVAMSQSGIAFLKELEGIHAGPIEEAYNDSVGNCTIGYGHLIHYGPCGGDPAEDYFRNFIRQYGVQALFLQDLQERAMEYVREYVTIPLSQPQFDALTSYTFNRGGGNLQLLVNQAGLNQGNYAVIPLIMLGDKHIPSTIPELEGRRCDEAELFRDGDYTIQRRDPCPLKP